MKIRFLTALVASAVAISSFSGCKNYVKRDEFDARTGALDSRVGKLESRLDALEADLRERFAKYDAQIASFEGKVRIDLTTHFEYDSAALSGLDQPALTEFAEVISKHHPDALITVEGFTDPAGTTQYNQALGLRRANAVLGYLSTAGLSSAQLRAVSYGEAQNRQVQRGAWGEQGRPNRRVALVIDAAGKS
jgi:peptidoglycan-associated lipoprotein